jgi:hypothetical protein
MSKDECLELKNIKYQTMLLQKNTSRAQTEENIINMDRFLNQEKLQNKKKPWSKLEKATKLKKLVKFAENYNTKNKEVLKHYLFQCLERKKLQRTKDVDYDISTGKIKQIHGLSFNKNMYRFTLKKVDKKGSTLKHLAPKKKRKKKKIDIYLKD